MQYSLSVALSPKSVSSEYINLKKQLINIQYSKIFTRNSFTNSYLQPDLMVEGIIAGPQLKMLQCHCKRTKTAPSLRFPLHDV